MGAAEKRVDDDDMMTVEEAAEFLRVNKRTVYDEINNNRPPWAFRVGRIIRIHRGKLLAAFGAAPRKR